MKRSLLTAHLITFLLVFAGSACGGGDLDPRQGLEDPTTAPEAPQAPQAAPTSAATQVATETVGGVVEYTVESGDTLSGIAERFGADLQEVLELNEIDDPNLIHVGDVILLPR